MYAVDAACVLPSCRQAATGTRTLSSSRSSRSSSSSSSSKHSLCSTRATLDSTSTRTPVVAALALLRTARAELERTSKNSRFLSLLHRKKKARGHDHSTAQAQRARDKHEHGVAKQSRPYEHSAADVATPSGTRATTLDSSCTHTPVFAVVLLLRTARAALCAVVLQLQQ